MAKRKVYFADLTHTAQGISSSSFPLGCSFVVSYAQKQLNDEFDFQLFKFPEDLDGALRQEIPDMLCFSNYSWNLQLAYKFATLAKARKPGLITVFGGPNFPTDALEKIEFLKKKSAIDFYVVLEGEVGFVDLARKLIAYGFDAKKLKAQREMIQNTEYAHEDHLVSGPVERIKDINIIPSPYLTGILDKFFEADLIPMLETTRGCPFSCTFCADGLPTKNKIYRFEQQRTREELQYIARHVKNVDELIITDLNFAMYQEDLDTARAIAEIQKDFKYPILISASAGKNKPKKVIDVAGILSGSWTLGASIQSTDPEVLQAIKRNNISSEAYQELIEFGNSLPNSKTHTEIILGLPGDTKQKHFECLRFGVDNNVNNVRMYQAMLLSGTEMASRATRQRYGLITKFRVIPGCIGNYQLFGEKQSVAEIEEIIIGNKTMPVEDYIDCRIMNLIVETFHGNAVFEEVFRMVCILGASVFDCLLYVKQHPEFYSKKVQEIIEEFIKETRDDLYDSFDQANGYVLEDEIIDKYIGGELGINELLVHRALLFKEFEDISGLLFKAVCAVLKQKDLCTGKVADYLDDLRRFTILRKKDIFDNPDSVTMERFHYDFESIRDADFKIDPNHFPKLDTPEDFRFFHDDQQKKHIVNQVKLYANTPSGFGRLIQRSNLKLMYRIFTKV